MSKPTLLEKYFQNRGNTINFAVRNTVPPGTGGKPIKKKTTKKHIMAKDNTPNTEKNAVENLNDQLTGIEQKVQNNQNSSNRSNALSGKK